jgi:hypothetical protein
MSAAKVTSVAAAISSPLKEARPMPYAVGLLVEHTEGLPVKPKPDGMALPPAARIIYAVL